jgi:hypothetical protein
MARLIGYGAYNLCFDRDLAPYQGKDFFQFIREGGWPVNLVKVICYRNASQEGLPPNNARTIPLYTPSGQVSQAFLQNLQKLVQRARQFGFTVQICLFSYHSVARDEAPENRPAVLLPQSANRCDYMKYFFHAGPGSAVFTEQMKLVNAIVYHLRYTNNLSNVIWEVANELRVDNCGSLDANRAANCGMVNWINNIAYGIRQAAGTNPTVFTSTGVHSPNVVPPPPPGGSNEAITYSQRRPADGCANPPFTPPLFDLHSGQWDGWKGGDFATALQSGVRNRFVLGYGYQNPMFIINTDGLHESDRTETAVEAWAKAAFRSGYHFSTKQWYPPHENNYDIPVLNALKRANAAVP